MEQSYNTAFLSHVDLTDIVNLRSMFIKEKMESSMYINEISKGLECYGLLTLMKKHTVLFKHVFCQSFLFIWTSELFMEKLTPQFSEEGSNRKLKEINVFKLFRDFLECCFEDGECKLNSF